MEYYIQYKNREMGILGPFTSVFKAKAAAKRAALECLDDLEDSFYEGDNGDFFEAFLVTQVVEECNPVAHVKVTYKERSSKKAP